MIACARCGATCPLDYDELRCPGGDPALLPVLIPPEGWLAPGDDPDLLVCADCASPKEVAAYMAQLAGIEELLASITPNGADHGRDDAA